MYSDRANEHDEVECDLVVPGLGAIGFAFLVLAFSMKGFSFTRFRSLCTVTGSGTTRSHETKSSVIWSFLA